MRIVLLAAEGRSGVAIAELVGCSEPTMAKWRRAYAERGLAGLGDAPGRATPPDR
jgi:transposase-like protein